MSCIYVLARFYSRERERIFFFTGIPLSFGKSLCGVWLLWSLFVYIISFEDPQKKRKKEKKGGLFVVLLHCFRWCVVTSFVPRLTSLARSRLGPAQYHRWTIIQLAFVTNVVLVLPCFSPPIAPHISTTAWQVLLLRHRYTSFHGCRLVSCRHLLFGLVRTCKGLF